MPNSAKKVIPKTKAKNLQSYAKVYNQYPV